MEVNTDGIAGKTKTEFLSQTDLPEFDKNEVIRSILFESESVIGAEVVSDIDPEEINIETKLQGELEFRK